jgi:hypothetical protein
MPRLEIMALLKPPQEKETSFIAERLQPATIGSRLPHTYLERGVARGRGNAQGSGVWE